MGGDSGLASWLVESHGGRSLMDLNLLCMHSLKPGASVLDSVCGICRAV